MGLCGMGRQAKRPLEDGLREAYARFCDNIWEGRA